MQIALSGPVPTRQLACHLDQASRALAETYQGYGGTPVALLAEEYLRRGHEVTIFSLDRKATEEVILRGPQLTIFLGPGGRRRQYDFHRVERAYLRQTMRRESPPFVHAHWTYQFAMAAIEAGVPTLVTAHDAPWKIHTFHGWRAKPYWIMRALLATRVARRAASMTVVSPYLASYWRKVMHYDRALSLVPNGLPERAFRPRCHRLGAAPFTVATIFSGGWSGLKNGAVSLGAFAAFRRQVPRSRYLVWGSDTGPDQSLQRWACSAGVAGGVEFRGTVSHGAVLQAMAEEVDVLLAVSLEESFGMTLIEAMAAGVPVVAGKDAGGPPWILADGQAGVLVDARNVAHITHALHELKRDSPHRESVGRAGYRRAQEKFHIRTVADGYLQTYCNCFAVR